MSILERGGAYTTGCHGYHCRPEDVDAGIPLAPGMQEEMRRKDKEVCMYMYVRLRLSILSKDSTQKARHANVLPIQYTHITYTYRHKARNYKTKLHTKLDIL